VRQGSRLGGLAKLDCSELWEGIALPELYRIL